MTLLSPSPAKESSAFNSSHLPLPTDIRNLLQAAPSVAWIDSAEQLLDSVCGTPDSQYTEVSYELPNRPPIVEATVARVRNGVVVNYPDPYMRRRDPDSMFLADDAPTDKPRFRDRFGYDFASLRAESLAWLKSQHLAAFAFLAGPSPELGVTGLVIAPANAAFFALALGMLQRIIPAADLPPDFTPQSVIYIAPPFRHTHFQGKQVVVHRRAKDLHEVFAFNLYPGPSAKKGVYSILIHRAEQQGWIVPHCSTVQVVTPYDNIVTIMHEGASGGGKSEMLEQIHREPDGRLLLGRNLITGEQRFLEVPRACELHPVTDDMALCHPSLRQPDQHLRLVDAENGWFVRVNHIREYGTDPFLEKLTAQPSEPLVFLNVDAVPGSRALIWEHTQDSPGKPCPNTRVILPRRAIPNVVGEPVAVDIRSFGVRTPPCTRENPSYGIIGILHLLPPALAWLWRLVSPRGHANPSIVDSETMASEGVGSYWPFATGRRVTQANLLLDQIQSTRGIRYILTPNQHVGAWHTGFMPQWIAREYLARRGHARYRPDQLIAARCPLLGHTLRQLHVEGRMIPNDLLQVDQQPEVGTAAYDHGAQILQTFFHQELPQYLAPDLSPLARKIIEACLANAPLDTYESLLPAK